MDGYVSKFYCLFVIACCLSFGHTLDCYVCTNQEENSEKCLTSIKTCEQEQDVCLTEIKWGSTPYWNQGAKKQFYISKRCSTKTQCERIRQNYMPYCTHIWYQDWKCAECCLGDKCNYFIISAGKTTGADWKLISTIVFFSLVTFRTVR